MNKRKMDYATYEQRLLYIEELARKGRLLSVSQLSRSFDCDDRTVRRMLNNLRNKGIEIRYSNTFKKFIIVNRPDR